MVCAALALLRLSPPVDALSAPRQWNSIGPMPLANLFNPTNPAAFNSGRVATIAVDPSDVTHWLIGAGNGGVWESRNSGTSWLPLTDGAPTLAIGAVAFAPSNPNIVYATTGEAVTVGFAKAGLGMLKSIDGGQNWNLLAAASFARASCGAPPAWTNVTPASTSIHPDHHALAWAGTRLIDGNDGGVWSTADLGASWQNHNAGLPTNMFFSGARHPADPNFIVGGTGTSLLPPAAEAGRHGPL